MDESALTGESEPAEKDALCPAEADASIGDMGKIAGYLNDAPTLKVADVSAWSRPGVVHLVDMVLIRPFGAIFGLVSIGPMDWLFLMSLTLVPTVVTEIYKLWGNRCETKLCPRRLVRHSLREDEWCA